MFLTRGGEADVGVGWLGIVFQAGTLADMALLGSACSQQGSVQQSKSLSESSRHMGRKPGAAVK